jgi:hypothetical protein
LSVSVPDPPLSQRFVPVPDIGTFNATVELLPKATMFVPPEKLKVFPPLAFRVRGDVF